MSSSPSPFFLKILKTFDAVYLMPLRLPLKFLVNSGFHTSVFTGSEIYIFGGEATNATFYNKTYGVTLPVPIIYYKKP